MADRQPYPTDLTDDEFARIEKLVPGSKSGTARGGRPEEYTKREVVNAILYVVRSGCQWRMVPHDLPPWSLTYKYFATWSRAGIWERINDKLRGDVRVSEGHDRYPSAGIVDSQSVKTTEKGARAVLMRARKSVDARGTCLSTRSGC